MAQTHCAYFVTHVRLTKQGLLLSENKYHLGIAAKVFNKTNISRSGRQRTYTSQHIAYAVLLKCDQYG
jgi:hypothetical protein